MANFFYIDSTGTKQGPVTFAQLKVLANQGIITHETRLETVGGRKGRAKQVKGLFPAEPVHSVDTLPDFVENSMVSPKFVKHFFQDVVGFKVDSTEENVIVLHLNAHNVIVEVHTIDNAAYNIQFFSLYTLDERASENRRCRFCNKMNRSWKMIRCAIADDCLVMDYWIDVRQGLSPKMLASSAVWFTAIADDIVRAATDEDLLK